MIPALSVHRIESPVFGLIPEDKRIKNGEKTR